MKATELISRLAKLIEEHGDLEMRVYTDCTDQSVQVELKSVYEEDDRVGLWLNPEPIFEIYGE